MFLRRRTFLTGGSVLFGSLASGVLHGQPIPPGLRRVAICIGIDSYDNGPASLRAAVKGANEMASMLGDEGFEVTRLLGTGRDDASMVFGRQVFNAVSEAVEDNNVGQLVIYFSGHGVLTGGLEYWLLSDAPRNSSEAISVWLTAGRATNSGIQNVVLISDACRSPAKTWGMNQLNSYHIFPGDTAYGHSDVDIFYGTGTGDEAVEMPLEERAGAYDGIFTSAFLKAFREPIPTMVVTAPDGRRVIPNRRLNAFLIDEVHAALRNRPRYSQTPDAFLMANEPTYIARVHKDWLATDRTLICTGNPPTCTKVPPPVLPKPEEVSVPAALQSGFEEASRGNNPFPTLTNAAPSQATLTAAALVGTAVERQRGDMVLEIPGIAVYGGGIVEAAGVGIDAQLTGEGEQGPNRIEVNLNGPGGAVALRFTDGSGTILPVLGEIGTHVTLDETGIRDIRFNPLGLIVEDEYLLSLRALAAEATRAGVLRFEGSAEQRREAAERFAGTVRMGKGTDPMLGLFAAYAYSNALIPEGARSVHEIMSSGLGIDLFDAAMLAGKLAETCGDNRLIPPFPMLRQGWELLGPMGVTLHPALADTRPNLSEALWTTFNPEGTTQLLNLVMEGVLPC